MASSSGTALGARRPSKKITRATTIVDPTGENIPIDSEIVPSSLAVIAPILRVANEIEKYNNRVAYLCRFHAFEKAHKMDPTSSGRGVRQFKTYLLHRLEKEESITRPLLSKSDPSEIQKFYQNFCEMNIRQGQHTKTPEEMAKMYQIATVLYDVLMTVVPDSKVEDETKSYAKEIERNRGQYEHYNILPLSAVVAKLAIMELSEIKAAIRAIRNLNNLPMPQVRSASSPHDENVIVPEYRDKSISDILDWLVSIFGFQKGNVANQREHLILILANMEARTTMLEAYEQLDNSTIDELLDIIFRNYRLWCDYLHCESNLRFLPGVDLQQLKLIYIALYLLIWGEASNVRFMPECLCYIFHNIFMERGVDKLVWTGLVFLAGFSLQVVIYCKNYVPDGSMASELHGILNSNVHPVSGDNYQTATHSEEAFLNDVIAPIYEVLKEEAKRNKNGKASHSAWRNYDDLNEYFWSQKCFKLGWPMDPKADFFVHSHGSAPAVGVPQHQHDPVTVSNSKPKTNFVEVRTFLHLFRSFDRMWIFFILALQAMVIVAWSPSGSITSIFDGGVFRSVLSIFITSAFLNLFRATLDIILSWKAWGSLRFSQILRYLLKFAVAAMWAVVLPIGYSSSVQNPTGLVKFFRSWGGDWRSQSFYNYAIAIYMLPNIFSAVLFLFPSVRKFFECSNWRIITLFMWWAQPKLYVGRGMHEDIFSLLKYTLFWIMLLISKLAFSYYVEILPLVGPTKQILNMTVDTYEWPEVLPSAAHNFGVIIAIWVPIILVYFMDAQIWYAIYSTIFGGILGAFSHLGEIRTLGMLRSRFGSVPLAFRKRLVPSTKEEASGRNPQSESADRRNIAIFSQVWNEFIHSLRLEDLINNKEKDLLLVPYSSSKVSVVQWPPFLLASKIPIALDMAKDFKGMEDEELFKKIRNDDYMFFAVIECYETLREILSELVEDNDDKEVISIIFERVESSIHHHEFLANYRMSGMPLLHDKLEKFLKLLLNEDEYEDRDLYRSLIINVLQDIVEIITKDVMIGGHDIMGKPDSNHPDDYKNKREQRFENINVDILADKYWKEKIVRLQVILSEKESAINVPMNLDARRRITFFANSLFMTMPSAPKVRNMLSFSVLTPYFKEDVLYSEDELKKENEDGISTLFYLQKIYPDEWSNFQQRIKDPKQGFAEQDEMELTRQWVSYRGQTLSRTVRGMMYYRQALDLQCFLESEGDEIFSGYRTIDKTDAHIREIFDKSQALTDLKFTYVVSCQVYGAQKKSSDKRDRSCAQNILNLMIKYPSLRVAYIDERDVKVNGKSEKVYYSVLVKGGDKLDEEIYRIKLPGQPTQIGEGKPENQNHAIIFTRGEALQTIDMNQDNYFEEAFKMRNVLEEFQKNHHGRRKPTILGLREHIFTGSVSSLAGFMSNQETSFVTIGQRVLANPLRVRFHYGHPDIFDRLFHITRGGLSKASRIINLSEDIFSGFNSTLRAGYVTHHEYIQVGKGRDVGMIQISLFEAKVANGNGEQTLSRDVHRLGRRFDFYRMLSFYFTTIGFYFSSMITVLIVYAFLYGRLYMILSGLERAILENAAINQNKGLEEALATQSIFQLGLLLVLPMVMEIGLERGFRTALGDFIIMQLQLASVFFTFQLGTKAHYYGRTLLHGGSKYRATGRGFVVFHAKFADNYRRYSRSHFVKGLEILILLILYEAYAEAYRSSKLYLFVTWSMWFLVVSWLFAPFVFNPSGFDWQKTVDDWTDWKRWMGNRGGIGIQPEKSWESWWDGEQEHLKYTTIRGRLLEIILASRFILYQYGIVYHLDIAHNNRSLLVYGLSWVVMATVLLVLKMVSMGRRRFGTDFQLMFRILKGLLFLGFVSVMTVLFVVCGLTVSDLFASVVAFLPTGWAFILVGQACRPMVKGIGFWESIKELARAYDYVMGLVIFTPIAVLSWFPFVSEFQTRLLFNQAFSRGLQISMILSGRKDESVASTKHGEESSANTNLSRKGTT